MSPEQKRHAVSASYPGSSWTQKVQLMSDAQIHVIYIRLMNSSKLRT